MSYHSRRIATPGASKKRKETEPFYPFKPAPSAYTAQLGASKPAGGAFIKPENSVSCSNKLLAGYLAYEYLKQGTLFGQKFDPGYGGSVESAKRGKPMEVGTGSNEEQKSYAEVASILKTEGSHLPGIVNPSQLSRWIQM
ncbi:uncharacterized protein LOC126668091 [Mercurialis annua]|uniref:uncharacterized protein LOC126668091 n=1 Tax=Mercurialis annua TaxID=3986 RepID=UPI0021601CFE|nr:uncharacterized protein LOC126668091 [Mercurialis annua]